jgi:crotonobetainyl-CoA:carnitine CoA-transferase CaiB-like acyl-CoA transferase
VLFSETPSVCDRPAPALGAHQGELEEIMASWRASLDAGGGDASAERGAVGRPPLEGVTIVEAATFIASPLGALLLGEMGARVIKVESLEGDGYRLTGLENSHVTQGKESLSVDLKTTEGREIVQRIVANSDVFLHNFRPGVTERLGVDYETLRAINPSLVYIYGASYGSRGAESHRTAFHSTPNALCGGGIFQAGAGNPPVDDSYPDPCAALGVGVALAVGLLAKSRFGVGQYMETTMLCSSGWVHSNRILQYLKRPDLPDVDQGQHGLHALYRLYKCSDGWVFLAAPLDRDWTRVKDVLGDDLTLAGNGYDTASQRAENDDRLSVALSDLFALKPAAYWEERLRTGGVSASSAADCTFEEFALRADYIEPRTHPVFGDFWRLRPRVRFPDRANRQGDPCLVGEHTLSLLTERGYSNEAIDQLRQSRVVRALEDDQ